MMADSSGHVQSKGELSGDETARLSEQIASLTAAGLPLGPGLAALGEELLRGRLKGALAELSQALEAGVPLEKAVEQQRNRIPPHLRGLVLGGLRSGRLGDILGRFTGYMSIGTDIRRKLLLSMAYPVLSILVALTLFLFVSLVIVVMFENLFRDFGVPLPGLTIAIIVVARFARSAWPIFAILCAAIVGAWIFIRLFLSAPQRRSLITEIPIVGRVWRYIAWAEFCHLLALLLESRLPLPEALQLTGEGVENAHLDRACLLMSDDVERGASLAQAMMQRRELPAGLPRLLRWAGDHGAQSEILHMVGEMFEARARSQATFAGTVLAVMAVVFVLLGMAAVVIGLMLPLLTLISKLSG
ncbi:MAG: type II secretion system F family protein [Isosphaeraceae bacterium]